MIRVAVILAAGLGTRLRPETESVPKCLVKVYGKPILQYQIDMLVAAGVQRVLIVAGYKADEVVGFVRTQSVPIDVIVNDRYASTNNMYSLMLALRSLADSDLEWQGVLVLNGDVVYETDFLFRGGFPRHSSVFVDTSIYVSESMKIRLDDRDLISEMSKTIDRHESSGVSVDMYWFDHQSAVDLLREIEIFVRNEGETFWTEVLLSRLAKTRKMDLRVADVTGLVWWEIDNSEDKFRAFCRLRLLEDISLLNEAQLFLFDVDGTVILGDSETPGASEFISYCKSLGKPVGYITNNSSLTNEDHRCRIENVLKIPVRLPEIQSSVDHLASWLECAGVDRAFMLLPSAVKDQIIGVEDTNAEPQVVVVGFDTQITYSKLAEACRYIEKGTRWLLVHPDTRCPTQWGFAPDAGSFGALVEMVTGTRPDHSGGKPDPWMIESISERMGVDLSHVVFCGDRMTTDAKMGFNAGVTTVVLLTGDCSVEEIASDPHLVERLHRPGFYVVDDLRCFYNMLSRHVS